MAFVQYKSDFDPGKHRWSADMQIRHDTYDILDSEFARLLIAVVEMPKLWVCRPPRLLV